MADRRRVDPRDPDPEAIRRAVVLLRNGSLVVVPTETVYGVAADPAAEDAVGAIYRAKGRPADKAIAYLVDGIETARRDGAHFSPRAARLASRFWPGPLTLVVPARGEERGYRVPDHPVTLALLRSRGGPLAVSSANRSGEPPARTAAEAEHALGPSVAMVLDAGPVTAGIPSTVVRVRRDALEMLREGAIPAGDIEVEAA